MAADTLKSVSITALDIMNASAGPIQAVTSGEGAAGFLKETGDYVTPTAAGLDNTGSTYKLVRLPFNAKVKDITLYSDGPLATDTTLTLDVGAYYSDSTVDGTPAALQGTAISVNCFAAVLTGFQSSAVGPVYALSNFPVLERNEYLWSALGLSSNPGGFVDVVVAVHTADSTGASHNLYASVKYVQG